MRRVGWLRRGGRLSRRMPIKFRYSPLGDECATNCLGLLGESQAGVCMEVATA